MVENELDYEEALVKSFSLLKHHVNFLETIEQNQSLALRKALDELMKRQKKQKLLDAIMPLSLALIFYIVAYIATDIIVSIVSLGFGVMLSVVGLWRHLTEI